MERKPTYEELEQNVKELRWEVKRLKSILRNKAFHNELDGQKVESHLNEKLTDSSFPKKIPTFWFDRYLDNRIVKYEYPIHISGEPGTCKESLALYIHSKSARRKFKFVTVNCSSMADDILEQELFGHFEDHFISQFEISNVSSAFVCSHLHGSGFILTKIPPMMNF